MVLTAIKVITDCIDIICASTRNLEAYEAYLHALSLVVAIQLKSL